MGFDCDACFSTSLHEYYTLKSGCEVCSKCYGRIKELERQKKECEDTMKTYENDKEGFDYRHYQRSLEKVNEKLEEAQKPIDWKEVMVNLKFLKQV